MSGIIAAVNSFVSVAILLVDMLLFNSDTKYSNLSQLAFHVWALAVYALGAYGSTTLDAAMVAFMGIFLGTHLTLIGAGVLPLFPTSKGSEMGVASVGWMLVVQGAGSYAMVKIYQQYILMCLLNHGDNDKEEHRQLVDSPPPYSLV